MTTNTVKRSDLSAWKMVAGNEDRYPVVVDDGRRKDWVGIGWIDIGPASEKDVAEFPTVVED